VSDAPPETLPGFLTRVAPARHRVEECLQCGKRKTRLAEFTCRHGVDHHQAPPLTAAWSLVQKARRGRKLTPALTQPKVHAERSSVLRPACRCGEPERVARGRQRWLVRTALARFYRWKKCKRLAPVRKRLMI
jgi:hypothetical protein